MLKVVCAWCGKHLKGSETAVEVSHGICDACQTKTEADYPLLLAAQRGAGAVISDGEGHLRTDPIAGEMT